MSANAAYLGKTNRAILSGAEDVSLWSDEELMRGQRRASNGKWVGRPPKVVPKALHDELVRRKMSAAHDLMRDNVVAATTVLVEIAQDKEVDPAVRLKAVGMIQDRVLGKVTENVNAHLLVETPPWMKALESAVVTVASTQVIEATADDAA